MRLLNTLAITGFILLVSGFPVFAADLKTNEVFRDGQPVLESGQSNVGSTGSVSYSSLLRGSAFQTEKESFVFLPELYSIATFKTSDSYTLNLISAVQKDKSAALFKQKGNFSVYRSNASASLNTMATQATRKLTLYPVVLNTRTNNLGIVIGSIKVKLSDLSAASNLASTYNIKLVKSFDHLKTVFFEASANQDIILLTDSLSNDSRVQRATIEVIENVNIPQ